MNNVQSLQYRSTSTNMDEYTTYTWKNNKGEESSVTVILDRDKAWIHSSSERLEEECDIAEARTWYSKLCREFGHKPTEYTNFC